MAESSEAAGQRPADALQVANEGVARHVARIDHTIRAAAVGAFLLLLAWLLWDILLLGFAAVLVGCLLRGAAAFLHRRTGIGDGWAVGVVAGGLVVLVGALAWWRGAEIAAQAQLLADQLTAQGRRLWEQVNNDAAGARLVDSLRQPVRSAAEGMLGYATGIASSALGIGGGLVVVAVTGVCLAAAPGLYVGGALRLLPPRWRSRGRAVMEATGESLQLWFLGQLFDMAVVTVLVGAGLWALGVPLAGTLAAFAGLLNFVPYIGALAGAVPAVLVALAQSPTMALWVALLFFVVQAVEGNLIAPLVQNRTGALPPAMTIMSQTILGTLFGVLGLILATPFMAALLVGVRMVYVESVLERREVRR